MVVMLAVLMMGCTSPTSTKVTRANSYISKGLGITFQFPEEYSRECKNVVEENGNSITSPEVNDNGCFGGTISVFEKLETQSIEDAILNLVKIEGRDPANCKVVKGDMNESGYVSYVMALADNYKIEYTADELKQIADADKQAALDKGPFNGEWQKGEIYGKRVKEVCSSVVRPVSAGTSKAAPSLFLYNEAKSKTKFIYTSGSADPQFFEFGLVEIL